MSLLVPSALTTQLRTGVPYPNVASMFPHVIPWRRPHPRIAVEDTRPQLSGGLAEIRNDSQRTSWRPLQELEEEDTEKHSAVSVADVAFQLLLPGRPCLPVFGFGPAAVCIPRKYVPT